jgi:hypothetical protein
MHGIGKGYFRDGQHLRRLRSSSTIDQFLRLAAQGTVEVLG